MLTPELEQLNREFTEAIKKYQQATGLPGFDQIVMVHTDRLVEVVKMIGWQLGFWTNQTMQVGLSQKDADRLIVNAIETGAAAARKRPMVSELREPRGTA